MDAEEAHSIASFDSQSPPLLYSSSTSFTIQHSVNMHNIIADFQIHQRRKQNALPRKKVYIEREKLRRMEISAPMPRSAHQEPRLRQTNERQVKTNSGYEMRKSPKRNANIIQLHPKQLDRVQEQEAPSAVRFFEDCVLPELKAHLPQPKSTIDGVLNFELQPSVSGNECTYASIYEIPPAAQTFQRSDCLRNHSEDGLLNEIMQESNTRSVSVTASDKSKMMNEQTQSEDNEGVAEKITRVM
uniref:Glycine--tRNA ligase beta subunit n=1 Tax=Zeugodacus cucurbitae TaxID=28588 RepID=A0A0A1WGV6_ZEUCU